MLIYYCSFLIHFLKIMFIGIQLLYIVVLVSTAQQSESAILFPYILILFS